MTIMMETVQILENYYIRVIIDVKNGRRRRRRESERVTLEVSGNLAIIFKALSFLSH